MTDRRSPKDKEIHVPTLEELQVKHPQVKPERFEYLTDLGNRLADRYAGFLTFIESDPEPSPPPKPDLLALSPAQEASLAAIGKAIEEAGFKSRPTGYPGDHSGHRGIPHTPFRCRPARALCRVPARNRIRTQAGGC